jgi:hypothetical protein
VCRCLCGALVDGAVRTDTACTMPCALTQRYIIGRHTCNLPVSCKFTAVIQSRYSRPQGLAKFHPS